MQPNRSSLSLLVLCVLVLGTLACQPTEPDGGQTTAAPVFDLGLPQGYETAQEAVTEDYLKTVIAELSDDGYGGRGPGTEGDVAARRYIAEQLAEAGFEPGGADGGWEQPFDIVGVTSSAPQAWTFRAGDESLDLTWYEEFIAGSGVQEDTATIEDAEVVFVGYGIQAPEYDWDDFKGRDLAGKVLVMLNNDPDWDPELFEGKRRLYYGRWDYKYESAARQGAAGAIIIHTTPSASYPFQVVQTSWTGEQVALPATGDARRPKIEAWTSWDASVKLFDFAGQSLDALIESAKQRDFEPVDLGLRTSLVLTNEINRDLTTANVLGLLRGSDPELADEVVVYTAHHDHLGTGQSDDPGADVIYNGARDNASGVAQVLAIARAFQALPSPPRRSVLIAVVAAEEQGLLGSKYFALHPTFPPGRIAANVNLDSAAIWGRTRDVTYVGYGKSSLDQVADAVAALQGRTVKPDPNPDHGSFYRSDQFAFAKIGVPAMYLDGGNDLVDGGEEMGRRIAEEWIDAHYHQPSDELDETWKFDGMAEDTRLAFLCGLSVAQTPGLPTWNPGDEFEAARQAALAALP